MKIQILSDQHIDFSKNFNYVINRCIPRCDTLVIAGDLCPHTEGHEKFITEHILPKWKNVIIIPGNHEFYGDDIDHKYFGSIETIYENQKGNKAYYVNNKIVELNGVYFVCSTLWSHIGYENALHIKTQMNDFYKITGMTIDIYNSIYRANVHFMEDAMSKIPNGKRCVVVTHHIPSYNLVNRRWREHPTNDAFSSDMDIFIMQHESKISHWIHGHSHDYLDETHSGIRFIRNPMGYPQERDCDMDMVISV